MAVNVSGGELDFRATLDTKPFDKNISKLKADIAKVGASKGFGKQDAEVKTLGRSIQSLSIQMQSYQAIVNKSTDPAQIALYNTRIQNLQKEITRMSNIGKAGFDNMGNVIVATTKKTSAFSNAIGKAWTGLYRLAYLLPGFGIAGLLAFAIDPIMNWIDKLDLFNKRATAAQETMNALNEVNKEANKEAGKELSSLKLLYGAATDVSLAMRDRVAAAEELKRQFPESFANSRTQAILNGEEKRTYDELTESILKTARAKAAKDKLDDIEAKRLDIAFQKEKIRNANENEKIRATKELKEAQEALNATYSDEQKSFRTTDEQIQKQIDNAHALSDARAEEAIKLQEKQDKILKDQANFLIKYVGQESLINATTGKPIRSSAGAPKAAVDAAAGMLTSWESLQADYKRRLMDQNEAELQAVRDRFAKFLREIEIFNADPRNKIKLNISGEVEAFRDQVLSDLRAKQQEVRDKIEREKQEKTLNEALRLAETHEQKVLAVQKKYADARAAIGSEISQEQSKVLENGLQRETDALNRSLVEDLDSYKNFFDNVADLSGERLNTAIQALESDLAALVAKHPELKAIADEILKRITGAKTAKTAEDFRNMADALGFMADAVKDFGGGLADALTTAADLAGQVFNIKRDIADFSKAQSQGNVMGQIASGLGIIGAGFNIMTTLNNFLDRETRADKQRAYNTELQVQATENLTKAMERQIKVAQEAYGTQKIEEYSKAIAESNRVIDEGNKSLQGRYAFTGDAELDEVIAKMNRGEKLSGWSLWGSSEKELARYVRNGRNPISTDMQELQRLLDSGKLDDQTAKIAQNMLNAADAIKEADNAMREFRTGTSFSTLADDFVDALASENPFETLGDNFEETMERAFLNSFKSQAFKEGLQQFYDALDEASKDGLTSDEVEQLREMYTELGKAEKARFDAMSEVTGIGFGRGIDNANSLQGAISHELTEETGGILAGLVRAAYEIQKQLLEVGRRKLELLGAIQTNTANTVTELQTAVTELKAINTNTKPKLTSGYKP